MNPVNLQRCAPRKQHSGPTASSAQKQRGIVLIIALIMLVIITLLATFSLRNSASTEMVSSNVRTTELATQAAEAALRYCEDQTATYVANVADPTKPAATITPLPYQASARWSQKTSGNLDYWDGSGSLTNPAWNAITSVINGTTNTFKRPPECMIERAFDPATTDPAVNINTYIVTVRGFGPEVAAANSSRDRPVGSEVWLQSTIGF